MGGGITMKAIRSSAILIVLGLVAQGCATGPVSPVGPEFRSAYDIEEVKVVVAEAVQLPPAYAERVSAYYAEKMTEEEKAAFDAFRGEAPRDDLAEQYLAFRTKALVRERVAPAFEGDRAAAITVVFTGTNVPNAYTMMNDGEVRETGYDLTLTDLVNGSVLVETPGGMVSSAPGSALAGGGGLVGMAFRYNAERRDLDAMAEATATTATQILTGDMLNTTFSTGAVRAFPTRIEPASPAAQPAP